MTTSVRTATARLAVVLRRDREIKPEAVRAARNALVAARLEQAILDALTMQPPYEPLAMSDRKRLAGILRDGLL